MREEPGAAAPLRVLLVEDHALVRAGVRKLLEEEPGIAVVGEAADGEAATRLFARLCDEPGVDVVLTDFSMPELDGAEVARRVKAHRPAARVLILSMHGDRERVEAALAAGADGYLLKQAPPPELPAALRAVARGESYLSPPLARQLAAVLRAGRASERRPDALTGRERELLTLIAGGQTSKEVARALGLSVKTVENHRSRILEKLGAPNTAAAVATARQLGLLDRL